MRNAAATPTREARRLTSSHLKREVPHVGVDAEAFLLDVEGPRPTQSPHPAIMTELGKETERGDGTNATVPLI